MNAVVPVNVQVPSSPSAPIVADFVEHAIRVAYVRRRDVTLLSEKDWSVPGIYVLLTDDGSFQLYVGKSTDLRARLRAHRARQAHVPEWTRAVAIQRDTTHGFNSAEIGYLEGRLSSELNAIHGLVVAKGKSDGDSTLPPHMMVALDALLPSILAAMRLAALDTYREGTEEQQFGKQSGSAPRTHTLIQGSVTDLLSSGLLRAGETLHLKQAGRTRQGSVSASGAIVVDGVSHRSPSAAGAAALGLKSNNGWDSWRVGSLDGPRLADLRAQLTVGGEE